MIIVLIGTVLFLFYIDKKVTIIVEKYIEDEVERLTTNIVSKSISNNITKIWNSKEITEESKKAIRWLVMETNFTINRLVA